MREHDFPPRFAHSLIEWSGLAPEEVEGGLKAKATQLLSRKGKGMRRRRRCIPRPSAYKVFKASSIFLTASS